MKFITLDMRGARTRHKHKAKVLVETIISLDQNQRKIHGNLTIDMILLLSIPINDQGGTQERKP
jgi:hypothetical protein